MIRINLLGGERQVKKKAIAFDIGRRITALCSVLLVLTAVGIGYWYYSLRQRSTELDAEILSAQHEQTRLQSIIRDVAAFDFTAGDGEFAPWATVACCVGNIPRTLRCFHPVLE